MAVETLWGHSGIAGSPALYGQAGQGIVFLDAVLKDGYGSITLNSLVVASGVATATYSSGHTFPQWLVVEVAGATPSGLNGRKRILTATGTTFTFDATGISDGAATGTITALVPGGGWTKEFVGTNKAAYRNDTVAGTGCYMRVDDAGSLDMRVVWYLGMTDVDNGTDPFPTAAQISGGAYFRKSSTIDAVPRAWQIAIDDRAFYCAVNSNGTGTYRGVTGGDMVKFSDYSAPYDAFMSMQNSAGGTHYIGYCDGSTASQKVYIPRVFDGTPGAVIGSKRAILGNSANVIGSTYPSPQTGGIMATDVTLIHDGASSTQARGLMPGYVVFLNNCGAALTWATPIILAGLASPVLPFPTSDTGGPWYGVSLGDWR